MSSIQQQRRVPQLIDILCFSAKCVYNPLNNHMINALPDSNYYVQLKDHNVFSKGEGGWGGGGHVIMCKPTTPTNKYPLLYLLSDIQRFPSLLTTTGNGYRTETYYRLRSPNIQFYCFLNSNEHYPETNFNVNIRNNSPLFRQLLYNFTIYIFIL